MIHHPILQIILDFFHLLATITWIGGMFFNVLILLPTVKKTLDPEMAGKFMITLFKRIRVMVYVSLLVLFVSGIPMKIASEYYVAIINFDSFWEIALFIKHVFVAFLALLAIYTFEILMPKIAKLAAKGSSAELLPLRKRQMILAAISFLFGIFVVFLSAMMNYL